MSKLNALPQVSTGMADGKRRLIEAAMRLAARDGTAFSSLGLRELAREAKLNHNTFYRHFEDLGELGQAAAAAVATQVMAGMKQVRRNAARHADATVGAADYMLDFARDNPELIVVGLREMHSSGSPMRKALQQVFDHIALESVEQIVSMNLAPGMDRDSLLKATWSIAYHMFSRSLDYLERPRERRAIRDEIVEFARAQFFGYAVARRGTGRRAKN